MITPHLLTAVTALVVLVSLGLAVLVAVTKAHRSRRERVVARRAAPHRPMLLAVASGEDDGAAGAYLTALPRGDWMDVREQVIGMLSKVRGAPAEALVQVLVAHGETAQALAGLRSRSLVRRARSAELLGLTRERAFVPALTPLLADRSGEVRLVAARALGALGDPAAALPMLAALAPVHGRPGVPASVVTEALLDLGVGVVPALREALDGDDPAALAVAASVAGHGAVRAVAPQLRRLLDEEVAPEVKMAAAAALGRVGAAADAAALGRHTDEAVAPALRRTCVAALGELGHRDALDTLTGLLGDRDTRVAELSGAALVRLGGAGAARLEAVAAGAGEAARAARHALAMAELRAGRRPLVQPVVPGLRG